MLRVRQHKARKHPGSHTAKYNIDRLVWYQGFERIEEAIARETAIKGLNRVKKIGLIVAVNPTWQDLSAGWGLPGEVKRVEPVGFEWGGDEAD